MRGSTGIFLLMFAILLSACTQKSADNANQLKSFIYCSEASPTIFNPQLLTDGPSSNASAKTVFDTLVAFEYGATTIQASLAKDWTVSKDNLTYTFNLRKGVNFHTTPYFTPTRNFNADDVLFSFYRQKDKKHTYHTVNGGHYDYWNGMKMGAIIKSVKKIDPYKVKIQLDKPNTPFLANLAMGFMSMHSKEYADHLVKIGKKEQIDHKPIGTGPFIFSSYEKDTLIRFKANQKYFAGAPQVDRLIFSITPDASVRYQKLKTGECHFIAQPSPQDVKSMEAKKDIKVLKKPGLNVGYLAMNVERPQLKNVLVRKAIHHALNRKAYINAVYLNNAIIAKNPIPPTMWSYHQENTTYDYDPEKSRSLLKAAGFPNGIPRTLSLWVLPISRPYNPNGKKMGEMMQSDLAKVGIKVKLVTYEWGTYLQKVKEGGHDLVQFGWSGDNGDPDNFLNILLSCAGITNGSNVSRWCHAKFNKLVTKAQSATSQLLRAKFYKEAQTVFKAEVPWVTLAHSIVYGAMRENVKGFKMDPLGHDIFSKVRLEP